jgi:hypothetical protein
MESREKGELIDLSIRRGLDEKTISDAIGRKPQSCM